MNKNILIRCDASESIGLGHLTRCLSLANDFKSSGFKVVFAIKNNKLAIERIKEKQFDMIIASENNFDYFNWIKDILEEKSIDIFIGDIRDGFPIELISYMKNKKILTVAIDEPSDYAKECDLCFYPPHANINKKEFKGKVYQGLEYVILRAEFYEKYEKKRNSIPNILVMMGGTDAYNLTLPVIKRVDAFKEDFDISVILSDKHKDIELLNNFSKISKHKIKIYNKVENMALFLDKIDFAISQFGTVAYEYLAKGIPATYIYIDKNNLELNYFIYNKFGSQYHINDINQFNIYNQVLSDCIFKKNQILKVINENI